MIDTQKELRNFKGVQKKEYYSLDEIVKGVPDRSITETDDKTYPGDKNEGPESDYIQKKMTSDEQWGGTKLSVDTCDVTNFTKVNKR